MTKRLSDEMKFKEQQKKLSKKRLRVVIYARFSSKMQNDESIETQVNACKEYAQENGMDVVRVYIDKAESGTGTENREAFKEMMMDSKFKKFDIVLIHKIDRFGRNNQEFAVNEYFLNQNGVEVVSVAQRFGDSPEEQLMRTITIGMAQYYSQNLSLEVSTKKKTYVKNGKYAGGNDPIGYKKIVYKEGELNTNGDYMTEGSIEWVIEPREAAIVRRIFSLYANGYGYFKICQILNREGITTKNGNLFNKDAIQKILRSERYIGKYIYNKKSKVIKGGKKQIVKNPESEWIIIEGMFPPIIDINLWDKVHTLINHYKKLSKTKNRNRRYLLTGKVVCGECNANYCGVSSKKTDYFNFYYRCNRRNRKHDLNNVCKNPNIRAIDLEDYIIKNLLEKLYTDEQIEQYAKNISEYFQSNKQDKSDEISKVLKEIERMKKRKSNLIDSKLDGLITGQDFEDKKKEIESTIEALTLQFDSLNFDDSFMYDADSIKEFLYKIASNRSEELIRDLLDLAIEKIVINRDTVDVYFYAFTPPSDDGGFTSTYLLRKVSSEPTNLTISNKQYLKYADGSIVGHLQVPRSYFAFKYE